MRKAMMVVAILSMVALLGLATSALAQPLRGQDRPGAGSGVGQALRGHLETNPEAERLWRRMGDLQTELRQKGWEMQELLNAEPRDPEAIKAKGKEIQELQQEMQRLQERMKEHWVQGEGPRGQQAGQRAGQRQQLAQRLRQHAGVPQQPLGQRLWQRAQMGQTGRPGMQAPPGRGMLSSSIAADCGKLYIVIGGRLIKLDGNTLKVEKVVPLPGLGQPGPFARGVPAGAPHGMGLQMGWPGALPAGGGPPGGRWARPGHAAPPPGGPGGPPPPPPPVF